MNIQDSPGIQTQGPTWILLIFENKDVQRNSSQPFSNLIGYISTFKSLRPHLVQKERSHFFCSKQCFFARIRVKQKVLEKNKSRTWPVVTYTITLPNCALIISFEHGLKMFKEICVKNGNTLRNPLPSWTLAINLVMDLFKINLQYKAQNIPKPSKTLIC